MVGDMGVWITWSCSLQVSQLCLRSISDVLFPSYNKCYWVHLNTKRTQTITGNSGHRVTWSPMVKCLVSTNVQYHARSCFLKLRKFSATDRMLLLLSHFSRVRLCVTPQTAHQAPLSLGFSRQERTLEWVTISFSNAWKWKGKVKSLSRVPTLHDPMHWSLPGSSIHGIFQARVLEWGAIAFS